MDQLTIPSQAPKKVSHFQCFAMIVVADIGIGNKIKVEIKICYDNTMTEMSFCRSTKRLLIERYLLSYPGQMDRQNLFWSQLIITRKRAIDCGQSPTPHALWSPKVGVEKSPFEIAVKRLDIDKSVNGARLSVCDCWCGKTVATFIIKVSWDDMDKNDIWRQIFHCLQSTCLEHITQRLTDTVSVWMTIKNSPVLI